VRAAPGRAAQGAATPRRRGVAEEAGASAEEFAQTVRTIEHAIMLAAAGGATIGGAVPRHRHPIHPIHRYHHTPTIAELLGRMHEEVAAMGVSMTPAHVELRAQIETLRADVAKTQVLLRCAVTPCCLHSARPPASSHTPLRLTPAPKSPPPTTDGA
jgi:hypothetical protein